MGKRKLSYAEAYTDFIKYCSYKEKIGVDTVKWKKWIVTLI